ncbi:MAG: putative ABC transport system permease protein [Flavobacteriaceae bacterium]
MLVKGDWGDNMLDIAYKSLKNRWLTALMAVIAIAMSVALILTVDKVRRDARTGFTQTVSGTDLIVGARSGSVQLLLYSVFRIGSATNNISWDSVTDIKRREAVDWVVPLSLGDSHRGFRVLGTTPDYFKHYQYAGDRSLQVQQGQQFEDVFDVVLGSEVARQLSYSLGHSIAVAHGTGKVALVEHDKQPFKVVGILEPTGTPVDHTLHVSLLGIEAMHVDWTNGMAVPGAGTSPEDIRRMDLIPKAVTALLVGLNSRGAVFREQRAINEYREEPLLAILPGVAIQELWSLVRVAENALLLVSSFVVLAGLVNLVSVLFAGLNERRREMAILRASGARPSHVFLLLCAESTVLSFLGLLAGVLLHYVVVVIGILWIQQRYGFSVEFSMLTVSDGLRMASIFIAGILVGCIPAWRAYRQSVADGMMHRM